MKHSLKMVYILEAQKTVGRVLLPEWLADEVRSMTPDQYWKIGMTTKMVSASIYKISRFKKAQELTGSRPINPHMLRHWYATDMIKRGFNPEVVRAGHQISAKGVAKSIFEDNSSFLSFIV